MWFAKPPPAPAPAPLPEPAEAWYATTILLYVFAAWGALSILTYLLPLLLSLVGRRVPNLRKLYGAEWAVVTGASSGIGKALTAALLEQGVNVVLVALDNDELKMTAAEMRVAYPEHQVRVVGADLSDASGAYMAQIITATSDIHISLLFNNAGFIVTGFFHATPLGKHLANVHCNATSVLHITHHFLPLMYKSGRRGLVCFTSSSGGYLPSPFTTCYSATKAFVSRFATSLAVEAGPQGVDVLAVHPSPVASAFLEGTSRFGIIDSFYRFSTEPEAVPDQIFQRCGNRFQVLADLGVPSVGLRLVTKLIDDNLFASVMTLAAPMLPDYVENAAKAGMTNHLKKKHVQ